MVAAAHKHHVTVRRTHTLTTMVAYAYVCGLKGGLVPPPATAVLPHTTNKPPDYALFDRPIYAVRTLRCMGK